MQRRADRDFTEYLLVGVSNFESTDTLTAHLSSLSKSLIAWCRSVALWEGSGGEDAPNMVLVVSQVELKNDKI